ncbi:MAG: sodium:solute symporter family protein [Candidatus Zhuqueibacterota bacterium]
MERLHPIDLGIVILYFLIILSIGLTLYRRERGSSASEFLLAGRQLSLPAFVATLVTTWYGGILGVGEFSYSYGISNWLVFGVPYYVAAVLFGMFLARKARSLELYTIPHHLERSYGRTVSLIGAVFVFIMSVPAAYILMLAVLMEFFFGLSLFWGLVAGTLLSMGYVVVGGFRSVVRTDYVQFGLMFGSFMIILPVAYANYGGMEFLQSHVPQSHFIWHGGQGAQYIIVWFFIALVTLIDPGFYQRCFAARSGRTAQMGIFVSILFWIFFDFLTTFTGLYARAILPDLKDPVTAYISLGQKLLPPAVLGIFLTGLLSTIMSTVDSYSFLAATTIGRDFFWRLKNGAPESKIRTYTQVGLIFSGALAVLIAYSAQSVVRIWKDIGSVGTPALVVPMVVSFYPTLKMTKKFVLVSMVGSALLSGVWVFSKSFNAGVYLFGIEPIYPGLGFSLFMFLLNHIYSAKRKG